MLFLIFIIIEKLQTSISSPASGHESLSFYGSVWKVKQLMGAVKQLVDF